MLTFTNSEEKQSHCFHLLGTAKPAQSTTNLLSNNTSLLSNVPSLLATGGGEDSCSFYSGPSDAAIMAFGEQAESCGSIAYSDGCETCGSIAYSSGGAISTGASVSSGVSSGGCSSGSGCSYSC